ncbi:hypothetical protein ACFLTV_01375 [Chloroflexota bacterium]
MTSVEHSSGSKKSEVIRIIEKMLPSGEITIPEVEGESGKSTLKSNGKSISVNDAESFDGFVPSQIRQCLKQEK